MALTPLHVSRLLGDLCVQLGFCLPPDSQLALQQNPPADPNSFTDAVFTAEGIDPATADRHLYRQVRGMIRDAFRKSGVNHG